MLNVSDHSRDSAGMTYVYPVVSRRAGGVSVGINLNVNNACNWACLYCQVENLTRGGPPPIDLQQLTTELDSLLATIQAGNGSGAGSGAAAGAALVDIAFSGNGESTAAAEFPAAVQAVCALMQRRALQVPLRLITNGSFLHRPGVQAGIRQIAAQGGEVWFKLDRATVTGVERVNQVPFSLERTRNALLRCAGLAETWIQTCWFALDGAEADESDGSFAKYHPTIAIITNCEADHLDHYGDEAHYRAAFVAHAGRATGHVIISIDDPDGLAVLEALPADVKSHTVAYGTTARESLPDLGGAAYVWIASESETAGSGVEQLTLHLPAAVTAGEPVSQSVALKVPGVHNARNAAAAISAREPASSSFSSAGSSSTTCASPTSTSLPRCITPMSSHMWRITARLWLMSR